MERLEIQCLYEYRGYSGHTSSVCCHTSSKTHRSSVSKYMSLNITCFSNSQNAIFAKPTVHLTQCLLPSFQLIFATPTLRYVVLVLSGLSYSGHSRVLSTRTVVIWSSSVLVEWLGNIKMSRCLGELKQ